MCGINMLFNGREEDVIAMNEAIAHRGTRSKVHNIPGTKVYFGHVRLPINGLGEEFDQPFTKGPATSMFVGEYLNYDQETYGCDHHALHDIFCQSGTDAFNKVDGFWAFAVHIHTQKRVNVYTDFLAKKPMYIRTMPDGRIGISSEIKALLVLGPVESNPYYYSQVMKWGYPLTDDTPFKDVVKMKPYHYFTYDIDTGLNGSGCYNVIRPKQHNLRKEMEQAVKNRLVADRPLSLLLSGGLDSTIIFEYVKRFRHDINQEIKLFHVGNGETEFLNYLDIPSDMTLTTLDVDYSSRSLPTREILTANDGPVDLGSLFPQYALGHEMKQHGVHVALSGDGADELFGGYRRAQEYDSQWSDVFQELVNYHLPRLDKLMMAHTIELRSPFLALPIVEHALNLPYKVRTKKQVLKKTFKDIVPKPILEREKHPLKSDMVIDDKMAWRKKLCDIYKLMF